MRLKVLHANGYFLRVFVNKDILNFNISILINTVDYIEQYLGEFNKNNKFWQCNCLLAFG